MRYGIVIRYEVDRAWLAMTRAEREEHQRRFRADVVGPYADRITVQHFDAEAFATGFSDFLLITTEDLQAYYYFVETLRDSDLVVRGWVRVHDITVGIEDGYREYERDTLSSPADVRAPATH